MWTKFGVVLFASAMLLVMEVSSEGFVNRLLKTTKSSGNNEGSARNKAAVGLFAHLASVVYRPLAKARRSASSMMRSTNSSSGSDDDDSIAFVEKATRLKVAKMQRSKQQQQSNRPSSWEGERRNYVPSDNNNLYLYPDETSSETHPEIRHHGKPPPLFTRQDRQHDETSSTFFDSRETPPHLQHFHEHLLNLIQSVPAAAAAADAPPRSRSSDMHGVEVDRTGDSKAGYVRFPSSDSTDPSHPSSYVRGGENKQNNKNNPQAHQHVLGSNNPGGKISKYSQHHSSSSKKHGQSLKKLSDASFDEDDTNISNEDNNEETNNDSGYSGGSQQQLFNPASYDDGDQQHSFPSAGPASVLSNIDVQIDVAPAGPSFNEEHNPSHNFDGDDDDDGHADYPHQNPAHEVDHVSGNHQQHFDGHHLQHSSIGPIAGSNSGSGITIPDDADVSINVGPSSLPAHSSFGPGPQVPLTYPKHGGGKHGVFLPNHIFDSALSGIAVLAFLSFLANRLGQGFLAGGRRRRKRSIFATSNHDGAADESFISLPYSSNDLPPQHLKVIFPKNYTDNAVDGRFQPLQYAVVKDGDVQWLLQSFGLRDL